MDATEKTPQNAITQAAPVAINEKSFNWRENFIVRVIVITLLVVGAITMADELFVKKYSGYAAFVMFFLVWGYVRDKVLVVRDGDFAKSVIVLMAVFLLFLFWKLIVMFVWLGWMTVAAQLGMA